MGKVRIIDLETENHEYLGQKASPYCPDNYIVMAGWRDDEDGLAGAKNCVEFDSREESESTPWFNLDDVDIIVAHNAMFEISWFLTRHREEFLKFVQRGGRVLCTQLAEYLISNQTETYPKLDEVAPRYGGTHKVDGVKILWEQGLLTSQIDRALLREYLIGPEGDVENTALTFYGQMETLIARGMWRMYLERCEGMLAFAFCENAGLYVNQEVAERNLAEQEAELAALNEEINKLLPELPPTFEFNWGSDYHLSALLFGGSVKYQERVPYDPPKYEKADFYKFGDTLIATHHFTEVFSDEDRAASWAATEAEYGAAVLYNSGKNKGQVKVFREDTDEEKLKWADALFTFPGVINLKQLPAVIGDKFLGKHAEYVGKRELPCGTPVYSTAGEVLEALGRHGFEQAGLLARRASLEKDNGTYYRSIEYNKDGSVKKVKGMLQFVGPDSIIHHSLNICSTVTGRLSSSSPNLQNLPRDGTSKVKQMFTSRFGDDGRIIEVDYTALEVVMLAALSGDQNLLQKLLDGTDMHCLRLAAKLNEPYEEVYEKCHNSEHPDHKRYKQMRTDIKAPSFAAQYGASAEGIAFATGVSVEFAREFLATEAALFPESIAFRQVMRDEVERTGQLPEGLQRECDDYGNWRVYRRGYWRSPGATHYSFRQYDQWKDTGKGRKERVMDYKDTQIANYGIQGEAGYMMTVSAGRVLRWLVSMPDIFLDKVFLINNVHDALYLDVHKDYVRDIGQGVAAIMADAAQYMSDELGYDIAHVPFPAVAEAGLSMYEKHRLE